MGKAAVLREKSLLQARGRRVIWQRGQGGCNRENGSSWRAGGWVGVMRVK